MRVHHGSCRGLVAALVLAGLGCGGQGKTVKFDGLVTLDDKPFAGATVEFIPLDDRGHAAAGVSDKDGIFHLTTFSPRDGALPGYYKVIVSKDPGDSASDATRRSPPTSAAEAKERYVKMGKELAQGQTKARRKPLVPAQYSDASRTPLRCQVPPDGKVVLAMQSS